MIPLSALALLACSEEAGGDLPKDAMGGAGGQGTAPTAAPTGSGVAGSPNGGVGGVGSVGGGGAGAALSTAGAGGEFSSGGAGGEPSSGGAAGEGGAAAEGGAGGTQDPQPVVDCAALVAAPLALEEDFASGLNGSEDLAFDGQGNFAASRGDEVVLVNAQGQVRVLTASGVPQQKYGRRFLSTGDLVIARPESGTLVLVNSEGEVNPLAEGFGTPNGVHVDSGDNIWVTETDGGQISKVTEAGVASPVVEIARPNGVFLDENRGWLYYSTLGGDVVRLQVSAGTPSGEPQPVTSIDGATLDGMDMDACGNLYVVDVSGRRLYRVMLDEQGAAVGEAERLVDAPIANAQFGRGAGFDELSIYGAGNDGRIVRAIIGVPGYRLGIQQ